VYPVILRIGTFEITSFGLMVAIGALTGLWLFRRELLHAKLPADAVDAAVWGLFGGLLGAKLLWTFEHMGEGEPFTSLLFSRGGMSWFGGFVGGVGAALLVMRVRRWPVIPLVAAATPALAVGHAIGRVGCLLVGDDYGRPSDLPWAIAFPEGLPPTDAPVHPTQIYEAIPLLLIALLLIRWRRHGLGDVAVLGRYLVMTGSLRFAIEFIRINDRLALNLTVAQWVAAAVVLTGIILLALGPGAGQKPGRPRRR
jgi:phosphatidylglycerol:prolipoprotein diacylglycerol transferase